MGIDLHHKTAIVTGSAGGIGLAIARRLAAAGANVVVSDLDDAATKTAADSIEGATAFTCDVRDEDQVQALVRHAVDTFGGLDVMVPNAGVVRVAPLVATDLAGWREVTSVNLDGVFLSMRYSAPAIIANGGGAIVPVASVTATAGTPLCGSYAAAKAGVVSLTQTMATELRGHNLRVNAVLPGFVGTALVDGNKAAFEEQLGLPSGGFNAIIEQKQGRYGTEEEVAEAVAFLASDATAFCNGSALVLDGGLRASLF